MNNTTINWVDFKYLATGTKYVTWKSIMKDSSGVNTVRCFTLSTCKLGLESQKIAGTWRAKLLLQKLLH